MYRSIALLIFLVTSCTGLSSSRYIVLYTQHNYKTSVCKVSIWKGGHGSGVAFKTNGNKTYILTAGHVVEGQEKHPFILHYAKKGKDYTEISFFVRKSYRDDLALLEVSDSQLDTLDLGPKDFSYLDDPGNPKSGKNVIAVGYMGPIYPPIMSMGRVLEVRPRMFLHTSGSYFGSSGGPVIDAESGAIVGITVALYVYDDVARSDRILAVNLEAIHEFLAENERSR